MKNTAKRQGNRRMQPLARTRDLFSGLRETLAGKRKDELTASRPGGDAILEGWPNLEVSENENEVDVRLEVPGLSEKDLELSYVEGTLLIKGEKKEEKEERKRDVYYRESRYGAFSRSIPIGKGVDFQNARAEYRNGVLKVLLPKIPGAAQRKQIPIT